MDAHSVQQENITAGGDVIAGDKNVIFNSNAPLKTLDELYRRFESERGSDRDDLIDQLKAFANQIDRKIIGLECKLSDAELSRLLEYALECKEKFEKNLYLHQYSLAAQEIYLYLMSKARSIFKSEANLAFPGMHPHEKTKFVRERLVQVLQEELGKNPLDLGCDEIYGIVFFLTGNCHIHWK